MPWFQKNSSILSLVLAVDKADGDVHGQRFTSCDLNRSESRIQYLPMCDIGGHAKAVLIVDMHGADGLSPARDNDQLPHRGGALEEFSDRHLAAC